MLLTIQGCCPRAAALYRVAAAAATTTDVVVPELNLLVLKHNLFCSAAKE